MSSVKATLIHFLSSTQKYRRTTTTTTAVINENYFLRTCCTNKRKVYMLENLRSGVADIGLLRRVVLIIISFSIIEHLKIYCFPYTSMSKLTVINSFDKCLLAVIIWNNCLQTTWNKWNFFTYFSFNHVYAYLIKLLTHRYRICTKIFFVNYFCCKFMGHVSVTHFTNSCKTKQTFVIICNLYSLFL